MIDWQLAANLLRTHYKPLKQVAVEIGEDPQYLNRVARGEAGEPKFSQGHAILDLAYDVLSPEQFERLRT